MASTLPLLLVLQGSNLENAPRRQHRKLATQLMTPKALQGYARTMDYEAHIFIRSLYEETKQGKLPINPAHYSGRFALK